MSTLGGILTPQYRGFYSCGQATKKISLSYLGTYSNPMLLDYWLYITNSNLERLWVFFPYSIGFLYIFLIRPDHNRRQ